MALTGPPAAGFLNTIVRLKTNVPEMPRLELPVSALVRTGAGAGSARGGGP